MSFLGRKLKDDQWSSGWSPLSGKGVAAGPFCASLCSLLCVETLPKAPDNALLLVCSESAFSYSKYINTEMGGGIPFLL